MKYLRGISTRIHHFKKDIDSTPTDSTTTHIRVTPTSTNKHPPN